MRDPCGRDREPSRLGVVPGPQIAHFPLAVLGAAGRTLQPWLAAVLHVAGEKIAASDPVLTVDRGEGCNGAARPGLRILPRHAAVLAALDQNLAHGGTGDREVGLGRHLRGRLGRCGSRRVGLSGRAGILVRKHGVELVGDTAAAPPSAPRRASTRAPAGAASPRAMSPTFLYNGAAGTASLAPTPPPGYSAECLNQLR